MSDTQVISSRGADRFRSVMDGEAEGQDPGVSGGAGVSVVKGWVCDGQGPPWVVSRHNRRLIDLEWFVVLIVVVVFGGFMGDWAWLWGVGLAAGVTVFTYGLVGWVVRKLRPVDVMDSWLHALGLGVLVGLVLPVTSPTAILVLAGLNTGVLAHLVGRSRRLRIHTVAVGVVLIWSVWVIQDRFHWTGHRVGPTRRVERQGLDRPPTPMADAGGFDFRGGGWPWLTEGPLHGAGGQVDPYEVVLRRQKDFLRYRSLLRDMLTRGRLCPLAGVILGTGRGVQTLAAPVVVILAGLYLMYRRMSWWLMVVAALGGTLVTLMMLPVQDEGRWTVVAARLIDLGPIVATTYVSYLILASPWCLIVMVMAPACAPMCGRGKLVYGLVLGAVLALLPWYVPTPGAAYLGLVVVGLLSRPLDELNKSPFVG